MANEDLEQLRAQREQLVSELKANVDTLSAEQKRQGLMAVRQMDQRLTAAAAQEAKVAEEAALQERPLSVTGEQVPEPSPFRLPGGMSPEGQALFRESAERGLKRTLEGTMQLAQRVKIGVKNLAGAPTARDELQLDKDMLEFRKSQQNFRAELTLDARALGVGPWSVRAAEEIGAIMPEAAATGGFASLFRTSIKRIGVEGGLAALGGAVQPAASDAEFWTNTLASAGIGTGIASGVWVVSAPANTTLRSLETGRSGILESAGFTHPKEVGLSGNFAKEAQFLAERFDPNLRLTPAMLTQNKNIAQMERSVVGSPGSPKQQTMKRIEDVVYNRFEQIANKLNPDNVSFPTIVHTARGQMRKGRDALVNRRKQAWNNTMDEAVELSGGKVLREGTNVRRVGGKPIVEAETFSRTLDSLTDDAMEHQLLNEEAEKAVMKFRSRWVNRLDPNTGRMSAADAQQLLIELTDELGGTGQAFSALGGNPAKRWANTLKDAVMKDLDTTANRLDEVEARIMQTPAGQKPRLRPGDMDAKQASETAKLLRAARENYTVASEGIESFEAKALWKTLNNLDETNSSWFDKVMDLEPEEMTDFLKLAEDAQPGLANAVRGRVLMDSFGRNKVNRVVEAGESAQQQFNLRGVFGDLSASKKNGVSRFQALFPEGKYNASEIAQANDGLKVLQLIATPNLGDEPVSFAAKYREAAINVISQSPEFFGRWVLGEFQPMTLEKMIYSDEGVQALMQLGKFKGKERFVLDTVGRGKGPQTFTQAVAAFSQVGTRILDEERQMQELEESIKRREAIAAESARMGGNK